MAQELAGNEKQLRGEKERRFLTNDNGGSTAAKKAQTKHAECI